MPNKISFDCKILLEDELKFQAEDFEIPQSKIESIIDSGESTEQVLETGAFLKDGIHFKVDTEQMQSFVQNFKDRVLGTDPPVNFGHERGGEASGWIKDLFLDPTKTKLFAIIKWTASGLVALKGLTWRYVSAEFTNRFVDGSTGKQFGPTLAGVALTNVPFLRHMPPVVGLSTENDEIELIQQTLDDEGDNAMDKDRDGISIQDHNAAVKVLTLANEKLTKENSELTIMSEEASKLKSSNVEINKELSELKDKIDQQRKENEFDKLLSESKACEAQRKPFMENKMTEFIKLAKPINLKGVGHTGNGDDDKVDKFSDLPKGEKKMFDQCLRVSMTEEDYMKHRKIPVQTMSVEPEEQLDA